MSSCEDEEEWVPEFKPQILENASSRGGKSFHYPSQVFIFKFKFYLGSLVLDGRGFVLGKKAQPKKKKGSAELIQTYLCTHRSLKKGKACNGTLQHNQTTDEWTIGNDHNHAGSREAERKVRFNVDLKKKVAENPTRSGGEIAMEVRQAHNVAGKKDGLCKQDSYRRKTNRLLNKGIPANPNDLEFILEEDFIPEEFLRKEIKEPGRRHLILSLPEMIDRARKAKRIAGDGTFHVVSFPAKQLLILSCFVKKGKCMKQVPVLFAIMSGKETTNYISVLKAFKEMLGETIMLEEVMLDFEPALWRAFDDVFGYLDIVIHGCYFHWKQAIMHHISICGLKKTYDNGSSNARILLKQLLALPILPEDQVKPIFAILKKNSLKVEEQNNMKKLFDYVQKQWIEARTFPPSKWSIFNIEFRTNNDLEG